MFSTPQILHAIYEVPNGEYDICPCCGSYKGQYHDPYCRVANKEEYQGEGFLKTLENGR